MSTNRQKQQSLRSRQVNLLRSRSTNVAPLILSLITMERNSSSFSSPLQWPPWLTTLLSATFFDECNCQESLNLKKDSRDRCKNYLDIEGCSVHCSHCAKKDRSLLQIRRNTHANAVRAQDLSPLISIEGIQCYSNNQARCIFLHPRDPLIPSSTSPAAKDMQGRCSTCDRKLMDSDSVYCSLGCKLNAMQSDLLPHTFKQLEVVEGVGQEDALCWPSGSKRSRYAHLTAAAAEITPAAGYGSGGKKKSKPSRSNFE